MALRFLQLSDLHAGSPLRGGHLRFTENLRKQLRQDMRNGLRAAMDLARQQQVDVVLCPGDVWDSEKVDAATASFVYDCFASIAPIPVLIAPGNHDPFQTLSFHNAPYYEREVKQPHPANVCVFDSADWTRVQLPTLPGVGFYGRCFVANVVQTERVLAELVVDAADELSVALLHGSQDDAGARQREGEAMSAPFSRQEVLASGADYVALGHYHRFSAIVDDAGRVRAAYGGIPVARGLDEMGEHFVLLGTIGPGGIAGTLEKVRVDTRRILDLPVELPRSPVATNVEAVRRVVESALNQAQVGPQDIARVQLVGRVAPAFPMADLNEALPEGVCLHAVLDASRVEPDYQINVLTTDSVQKKTLPGRFAARLQTMIADANAAGDTERAALLNEAMLYGLDALHGQEVRPREVPVD